MTSENEKLLNVVDMADILGVPPLWLKKQADEGVVPCLKIGSKFLFSVSATVRHVHEMASHTLAVNKSEHSSVSCKCQ